ncbi:protein DEHYDRATION-INDUCED 19 homolog 2-like [Musa acuminata AAA Group]|uniref:protein DEHYDRATION-INDUCED 19 homolog 2-like n=1 Tax=Musa acuminata AAA Group TaxID=214697 RepID=UPI0031E3296C
MEADSWSRLTSDSNRRQHTFQSLVDECLGFDDFDGASEDDDSRAEFACPFCSEEFDIIGLCCHIDDEHPDDSKDGVCPVCAARVEMDMVDHIAMQHGSFFKMPWRSRFHKDSLDFQSRSSLLRKDLCDSNLHAFLGGSTYTDSPSDSAPDPLLLSFIVNYPMADPLEDVRLEPVEKTSMVDKISVEKVVESVEPSLSHKDQGRARSSEFVRELVLSTIFEGSS